MSAFGEWNHDPAFLRSLDLLVSKAGHDGQLAAKRSRL